MNRYTVTEQSIEGSDGIAYILADSERRAEAILHPELGNNCVEFRTTPDPDGRWMDGEACAPVNLFMPPPDLADLRHSLACGGQPILFPFPNRVRAGQYTFDGETYNMADLLATGRHDGIGNAIHGLAGGKPWRVEEAQADAVGATVRCSLQMDAYPDIYAQYPFSCIITVTYRLREGCLHMETTVVNTGETALPMGFGIHPWFPTALRPGAALSDLGTLSDRERALAQVKVPATALWELENMLPTGNVIAAASLGAEFELSDYRPLNGHYYDHVFTRMKPDSDGWCRGGVRDPATGLELTLAADAGFREWVIYAPAHAPIVCLEPYTCTTDAVNLARQHVDAGLIVLNRGETWGGKIRFGLRRYEA